MSFPVNLAKHRQALLEILEESSKDTSRRTALKARGVSMEPLVCERDEVAIQAPGGGGIAIGDVIAYRSGNLLLVHRVVAIDRSGERPIYYEKGDNNLYLTPVTLDRILGVVTEVVTQRRRLALRSRRHRLLGRAVAVYGMRSVQVLGWLRSAGERVVKPGSAPSRAALTAASFVLKLPLQVALRFSRQLL